MGTPTQRYTLRDLPFAAKLVVTVFLLSVGLGYVSALVQLHFKGGTTPGDALPSITGTVARFSGKDLGVWWNEYLLGKPRVEAPPEATKPGGMVGGAGPEAPDVRPHVGGGPLVDIQGIVKTRCATCHSEDGEQSDHPLTKYEEIAVYLKSEMIDGEKSNRFLKLIADPPTPGKWSKDSSMSRAWTDKGDDWDDIKKLPDDKKKVELAERETERMALVAWVKAGASEKAYDDGFPLPPDLKERAKTKGMLKAGASAPTATPPIEQPKETVKAPYDPHKAARKKQISVDTLTQSTHAHLLTFCVLFGATGMVFAFTSYPGVVRSLLAPIVLIAQVADIACWWLSRLDGPGPLFALAIAGTGAVVGLGLGLQLLLGVFDLYGVKGKVVVALLMLVGFGLLGGLAGPAFQGRLAEEAKDAAPPEPAKSTEAPKPAEKVEAPAKPTVVAEKPADPPKTMTKLEE